MNCRDIYTRPSPSIINHCTEIINKQKHFNTTHYPFFNFTSNNISQLLCMQFLYKQYGVDPITYGYIMSSFAFLQLCSSPIVGKLADTFGAR